ncbi:MAG: NAD-dependent epimerase/dehydratase family protein [Thermoguttaceae bacterium]
MREKVFVTGSSGLIGSKVVELLLERGYAVRSLVRTFEKNTEIQKEMQNSSVYAAKNLGQLEFILGDITDLESLQYAMRGCQNVIHLAAYAKSWASSPKVYDSVNIDGTRNVFTAAQECGVRRIVWTSTIVTLGPTKNGEIGDEMKPRETNFFFTEYERSKTQMEHESASWIAQGLPLVIVNPTRVFGPGHLSESNTVTRLIYDYRRGRFPFLFNFGKNVGNYAFVDDVAMGHILAMEQGRVGERYILGGENATLKEFFDIIAKIDNKRRLQIPIKWFIPMILAHFFEQRAKWFGMYPLFTPGWIRTFLADWAFNCKKAEKELGYKITPLEEGIRRTCAWLSESQKT